MFMPAEERDHQSRETGNFNSRTCADHAGPAAADASAMAARRTFGGELKPDASEAAAAALVAFRRPSALLAPADFGSTDGASRKSPHPGGGRGFHGGGGGL